MCEFTTATLLALSAAASAASAGASYYSGTKNAEAQKNGIELDDKLQQQDFARQQDQQREAAAAQMNEHARRAFKDASLFDVVAGEFGGGNSTDRARAVSGIQTGEQLATLSKNAGNALAEGTLQANAAHMQSLAKLNTVQRPSALGLGLQLASIGVDYKTKMNKLEADQKEITKPVQ